MDSSPPGSSVHEILQARILEWVAISSRHSVKMCLLTRMHKCRDVLSSERAGTVYRQGQALQTDIVAGAEGSESSTCSGFKIFPELEHWKAGGGQLGKAELESQLPWLILPVPKIWHLPDFPCKPSRPNLIHMEKAGAP